ncbi:MAG: adenine phosphoribosyltransferase [Oscillatoriales cyanobacterium SM2_2_1]|nr:adenine phosphoribosyltransferase [Oscillatoriales cyanobacterium SM2_2_1]
MTFELQSLIRDVPDFPQSGILFRDLTPLWAHPDGLRAITTALAAGFEVAAVDYVVGIESRGFIVGAPLASAWGCGFIPVRKPNKLPPPVFQVEYTLEYGTDRLEMSQGILPAGSRVLIVDDVIATGGTAAATAQLVTSAGGVVAGFGFVIELTFLRGRDRLPEVPIHSLVCY